MKTVVNSPAKINLWLQVVRKRDDGYHDIWSLMLPIALSDTLELAWKEDPGVEIECSDPSVPFDSSNIVYKAYEAYRKATGWPTRGLIVKLYKAIPSGAGLGGGSSNGASILEFLNSHSPHPLSEGDLLKIGRQVGADVPFFIKGIPAIAEGIGDVLTPVEGIPLYHLLLIKPPFEVSTSFVYRSLKLTEKNDFISISMLLRSPGNLDGILVNDLEGVTSKIHPEIEEIKMWLRSEKALGALMTGSGPTVFGLFKTEKEAEEAYAKGLKTWGGGFWLSTSRVMAGKRS